jgi:ZIP family zinc transporter
MSYFIFKEPKIFNLINFLQLVVLGAFAGFTIFLGLPLALLQGVSARKKGFLNALAIGIIVFLIIDVFSHAWNSASEAALLAFKGVASSTDAALDLGALFGGIALGLLGLVAYEMRYMRKMSVTGAVVTAELEKGQVISLLEQQRLSAYKLSMMIAIGIGAHNFSEGLAIGQSYAAGSVDLAVLLIIGFGAHNATEGFGIAGPLTGLVSKPSLRFLAVAGLVGGGPTFIGTIAGSLWISNLAYIFFLSIAGGALIYVTMLMYNSGRKQTTNDVLMVGIFIGLCAGFLTDLIITLSGV